jgi:glycosyltransferase involved in cell wall biosynthesis
VTLLFLNPTGQIGGAEAALLEILAGLRDQQPGWRLILVVASAGPLVARARTLGIEVIVLPFPAALARLGEWGHREGFWSRVHLIASCARAALPVRRYQRQLRRVIREHSPDVVHTNGLKMHLIGAWSQPRDGITLWHLHDYVSRRPLTARLLRRYAGLCAMVVTNSRSVAADLRRVCGGDLPVQPVLNAVDLTHFSPIGPRLDLDELSGLPAAGTNVVRIGLLATFARWKGHHTFLKALALLPSSLPVRAYILGGPVYQTDASQLSVEELRNEVERLNLGTRVGFTGFVPDPALAIRSLDIVVHASTEPEPFGLVIAEAMACGKALVVSDTGGAAEIITPGVDALVHAPGDASALAAGIEELVRDEALRRRIGGAGRATAEQSFTRRRLIGELVPLYQALVGRRDYLPSTHHTTVSHSQEQFTHK